MSIPKVIKVQYTDIIKHKDNNKEPKNHSPFTDYCRELKALGEDPDTVLEAYRGKMLCLRWTVGEGSKWKTLENEKTGPRLVPYLPFKTWFKGVT